jgi:hypothetical protein
LRLSRILDNRKDGSRGALRIDYGDPRKPEKPIAWLWKFIDGAKTAGELYGRALVVIAAEQYASRLVVPSSQQHSPMRWSSHKDQARKALAKLAGPHLPATVKQVEKAIAKAHAEHETATRRPDTTRRTPAGVAGEVEAEQAETGALQGDRVGVDEYRDEVGDEDFDDDMPNIEENLGDVAGAVGPDGAVYSDADPGL